MKLKWWLSFAMYLSGTIKMNHTEYYEYSEEDRSIYTTLFEDSYFNDNIASEYVNSPWNYEVIKNVKFQKSVPTI